MSHKKLLKAYREEHANLKMCFDNDLIGKRELANTTKRFQFLESAIKELEEKKPSEGGEHGDYEEAPLTPSNKQGRSQSNEDQTLFAFGDGEDEDDGFSIEPTSSSTTSSDLTQSDEEQEMAQTDADDEDDLFLEVGNYNRLGRVREEYDDNE